MVLALGPLLAAGQPAGAADTGSSLESAESADDGHARVSDIEGDVLRRGPFHTEDEALSVNDLVREQDVLATEAGARLEIEVSGGAFVRLGETTHAAVERIAGGVHLNLLRGAAYVSRGAGSALVGLTIAGARIELHPGSVVRAEHDPDQKRATVYVDSGQAEVRDDGSRHVLEAGHASRLTPRAQEPHHEASPDDEFARWHAGRETLVRGYAAPDHVEGTPVGLYDLESHGRWVYVVDRWGWHPHVHDDWRPYRDGDWMWIEVYGWTWIPTARWGYVTHHYGRWHWVSGHGWVWFPGRVWGPGWVVWARFGGYVGWAPMDIHGRPVMIFVSSSYYDPATWCFARYSYFEHRRRYRDRKRFRRGPPEDGDPPGIVTMEREKLREFRPEALSETGPLIEPTREASSSNRAPRPRGPSLRAPDSSSRRAAKASRTPPAGPGEGQRATPRRTEPAMDRPLPPTRDISRSARRDTSGPLPPTRDISRSARRDTSGPLPPTRNVAPSTRRDSRTPLPPTRNVAPVRNAPTRTRGGVPPPQGRFQTRPGSAGRTPPTVIQPLPRAPRAEEPRRTRGSHLRGNGTDGRKTNAKTSKTPTPLRPTPLRRNPGGGTRK